MLKGISPLNTPSKSLRYALFKAPLQKGENRYREGMLLIQNQISKKYSRFEPRQSGGRAHALATKSVPSPSSIRGKVQGRVLQSREMTSNLGQDGCQL